jgi:competence ComEA-like helix-hairpin-helix protein
LHDPHERLVGVDLNTANVDQLMTLNGVTEGTARRIVDYREEHGPFQDIFEIFNIPKLGRLTFKSITGMAYSERKRHRLRRLARLLDLPPANASRLPSIADALTAKPGFTGCVISDKEGFLLASSGAAQYAEALSAVLPKMIGEMREQIRQFTTDTIDSVSITLQGQMFSVIENRDIFLTAAHEASRLTITQFRLVTRVAGELAWLLSHRGYVR